MLFSQFKSLVLAFLVGVITLGLQARPASGGIVVDPGYDLLYTISADFNFRGAGGLHVVEFVGEPILDFDFGPSSGNFLPQTSPNTNPNVPLGLQYVGRTDTIIQRRDGVSLPVHDPALHPLFAQTPIEMVALSLRSKNQLDWRFVGGVNEEFIKTVNVVDNGSFMNIFNDFTFNSFLDISFQLEGLTSGAKTPSIRKIFIADPGTWSHTPSSVNPAPVLISGVNYFLNGTNGGSDFFTGYSFHDAGDSTHVTIDINAVAAPEPSSLVLFGLGTLGAGFARRRRLRKVNPAC